MKLVQLNPVEALSFNLERDSTPKTVLRITNLSDSNVLFKVKTTQPSWYYVRPNQQVVKVGQTEEVHITLAANECNRLMDKQLANESESWDKHRFLVQSKALTEAEFSKITSMSIALRNDEYTKLWSSAEDVGSDKLKVEFIFPADGASSISPSTGAKTASEQVNEMRKTMSSRQSAIQSPQSTAHSSDHTGNIDKDLQILRKKYDDVIAYTVNLTAERDAATYKLEELKSELARDNARRKVDDPKHTKLDKGADGKRVVQQGFSLFVLIAMSFLAYLVGRYGRT